jgi:hypothetical protein
VKAIETAKAFSEKALDDIRRGIAGIVPENAVAVTCGSFARREASSESDIDFFFIGENNGQGAGQDDMAHEPAWTKDAEAAIYKAVGRPPAQGGAFAKAETLESMLRNIGGDADDNQKITRRMLFLLEGEWLFNPAGLKYARRQILERYIKAGMTDHQLALFLLNDIIRYYRTVAVDYEFKTVEGDAPKPWAIRNIKLVFSRKLLYASGLFSIAMTSDRARDEKITVLERLFEMPVIDRMRDICGPEAMASVLASYNRFLGKLEDAEIRELLTALKPEERDNPLFREMKNEGHYFSRELLRVFEQRFDSTHPIRRAIVF